MMIYRSARILFGNFMKNNFSNQFKVSEMYYNYNILNNIFFLYRALPIIGYYYRAMTLTNCLPTSKYLMLLVNG